MVERTFAWLCHNRRMSKDYERLCATSEAFVYESHDALDGKAASSWLGIFKQSLRTNAVASPGGISSVISCASGLLDVAKTINTVKVESVPFAIPTK